MQIFVTGTDTDIGKTVTSAWLCHHLGYSYFKPVQTGDQIDSDFVRKIASCHVHPSIYKLPTPLSPYNASIIDNIEIDPSRLVLPKDQNMIIEGAGGLMTPIWEDLLLIDLVKQWQVPVILVSKSKLGTINHSLLSIEALRSRGIELIGVIMNGTNDSHNKETIAKFGKVKILAELPEFNDWDELRTFIPPLEF